MCTKERILSIRLMKKIRATPAHAERLGVEAAISRPEGAATPKRKEQS